MLGQVYKVQTDSYLVKCGESLIIVGARGIVKKKGEVLLVGDFVEVENGVITNVLPRKNRFIRPSVSNVDVVIIVVSPEPKPDYYLIDKLLINCAKESVDVVFAVNKCDVESDLFNSLKKEYSMLNVKLFSVSALSGHGINELKEYLSGKFSVLAGQSAAGKTSLINAMFNLDLKTGELSNIGRGKHTTTRSEIFEYQNIKVIDSPGFAVIDADVLFDELSDYYPEYFSVSNQCKFRGCKHINEPDCKVKQLVDDGVFSKERYNRYVEIYNDLVKRRKIYEKN